MVKALDLSSGFKFCNKCQKDLELEKFSFRKTGKIFSTCKKCNAEISKSWNENNQEKRKEILENFAHNNPGIVSIYCKNYKINSSDKYKARNKKANRAYLKKYPEKDNAKKAKRNAIKLRATVCWSSDLYINMFYIMSKEATNTSKINHQVDHIVPLISPYVCGFHCEDNLQVLTASDNNSKSNNWWPDMWEITPELKQLIKESNVTN